VVLWPLLPSTLQHFNLITTVTNPDNQPSSAVTTSCNSTNQQLLNVATTPIVQHSDSSVQQITAVATPGFQQSSVVTTSSSTYQQLFTSTAATTPILLQPVNAIATSSNFVQTVPSDAQNTYSTDSLTDGDLEFLL